MMEPNRKLDSVDKTIIKTLLKNSRASFAEIADKCGVSTLTIKNRYNRLKKEGIIKGSTVLLNLSAFGNEVFAIYVIKVDASNIVLFERKLRDLFLDREDVQDVFCERVEFNERYNIVISLAMRDISEVRKVKELIRRQQFVVNIDVNVVYFDKTIPENLSLRVDE